MPMVARGKLHTDIRRLSALRSIAAEKETLHFPLEVRQRSIAGFAARIDDDGPLGV
jgi:hypothetical protein